MATLDNSKIHTLFPQVFITTFSCNNFHTLQLLPRDYYSKLENVTYGIFSQLYVKHMSGIPTYLISHKFIVCMYVCMCEFQ